MNYSGDALRALKEGILELGEWFPPATKADLALLQNSYNAEKAVCDTLKETGGCGDFGDFSASMLSFQKGFNEKILKIHQQVKVAKHFRILCAKSKAVNNR